MDESVASFIEYGLDAFLIDSNSLAHTVPLIDADCRQFRVALDDPQFAQTNERIVVKSALYIIQSELSAHESKNPIFKVGI